MSKPTVADVLVDRLAAAGVTHFFGLPGDSLNPVMDSFRRDGRIKFIHVRHEEVAAFAASAQAQLSGRLAACGGTSGPGNVHLINGLYDAQASRAPVFALASHILSHEIGTRYFQETHPERVFADCSEYSELVSEASQMPRVLQIAMQTAVSRQGVAVVSLPGDVSALPAVDLAERHDVVVDPPSVRPSSSDVEKLAAMINDAKSVTLYCGAGCRGAHDLVVELAAKIKAPVGHAWRGKQWVEPDNPYDVGMTGLLGYGGAYDAMHECDLLVLLGVNMPFEAFYPTGVKTAQIDIRGENLGRRSRLDHGVVGDVGETIRELLPLLHEKTDSALLDASVGKLDRWRKDLDVYVRHIGSGDTVHPELATHMIDAYADDDAVFTVDTGLCDVWGARYVRAKRDRRIIGSFNHGSMACAMPLAIGAQIEHPDRQVVALCGDGGFSMLMGDLLTIAQYDLPIKLFVYNNGALGFINLEMEVDGYVPFETGMKNPDFGKVAEAVGIYGARVEHPSDAEETIRKALAHPGPALVDLVTDPNALAIPAHVTGEQVKGFAIAAGRMALHGQVRDLLDSARENLRDLPEI